MLTYRPDTTSSSAGGVGTSLQLQAVGGAELNVAVAAARVAGGRDFSSFVSVLPAGPLGDEIAAVATDAGVAVGGVLRTDDATRGVGTLHVVDDGSGPRPLYQRHHSSFCATADAGAFDWPARLAGAAWLHAA